MRILIIEDNKLLCDSMKSELEKTGFAVDSSYTGLDGEEKAFTNEYDVILLDLNLPDKDGIDILKFLRTEQVATPVIIISARDEIADRANGLDMGADDYLVKPFELLELKSRVQAVIRRFYGRTTPGIDIGMMHIDPLARVVTWNGEKLLLSVKEFDILEYIASKYPAVVSSEEIAEHIYNEEYDPFSSVLRVHLTRLRRKLTDAAGYEILETTRGKGYSLCIEQK